MNNKPKYTLLKNTSYAIDGFKHALKSETSFKIELVIFLIFIPVIYLLPFELVYKIILIFSYMLIMIVELINSAIENVVDLVTKEIHPLAKTSKDIGATAVSFSVILNIVCWILISLDYFKLV
jgi:diacylglycerol kinase (ATP)